MRTLVADLAWARPDGAAEASLIRRPRIVVGDDGRIESIHVSDARPEHTEPSSLVVDLGRSLILPGLVNAHSHAFQRGLRGATHHGRPGDDESFWSWRDGMYALANSLDPDGVYDLTRACFAEMLASGITCVGEFHYLHHQPDGRPYADENELSRAVIAAAESVGIRLTLLEVFYARSGGDESGDRAARAEQARFCDADVHRYLARVAALSSATAGSDVRIGVAPHSVRAVGAPAIRAIAAFANEHQLPIHAHVSEQPRENEECRREHGRSPVEVFADNGALDRAGAFTAVHAIHVSDDDRAHLSGHTVCACPSTEADLGDGIVPATEHLRAGVALALGSDSNALIDLVREAGALEMNERLRTGRRVCLAQTHAGNTRVTGPLVQAMTRAGAHSLGRPELGELAAGAPFDAAVFDRTHPTISDVAEDFQLDALLLAGSAAACQQVWVDGARRC
jgi:formimidoylglutamate deiminase